MNMTTLYTLDPITGETVRVPIDLDNGAIDWLRMQPHHEPPSCVPDNEPRERKHYPAHVRLEQIRLAILQMDRPTQRKIAVTIGISHSRVCQILKEIGE